MAVKVWQLALVWAAHVVAVALCVAFFVLSHTAWGGLGWDHRSLQLVLMMIASMFASVLVWAVPKRQVVFAQCALVPAFLAMCNTIWDVHHQKCSP